MGVDASNNTAVLAEYVRDMRTAKFSEETIASRLRLLRCFATWLDDAPLLAVVEDDLRSYQATFGHLAASSVDVYSRHLRALYKWASDRHLIADNPAADLPAPRLPRGRPHPSSIEQLRIIFACTPIGALRVTYTLATFCGLRRGEICRMQVPDLYLDAELPTALIHGKGGHERIVPLLQPVIDELRANGLPRAGWLIRRNGKPYPPNQLSLDSLQHLRRLGVETTIHSMRHNFATSAARATRDLALVRELLGHQSLATTQIYVDPGLNDAHERLEAVAGMAAGLLGRDGARLRVVR